MKRLFSTVLVISLLGVTFFSMPSKLEAKTLGDLERELDNLEANLDKQEAEQQMTEAQIVETRANIASTRTKITKAQKDMIKLGEEIEKLNKDIEAKDQEIKDIINFVQVSNGEAAYLEYTFGAKDFTDFIYRAAVAEQLTTYNEKLIKDYNKMIKDNKRKKVELIEKEKDLVKLEESLKVELDRLGENLDDIQDIKVDLRKDIKTARAAIKLYKSMGCKSNEDLKTCGRNTLPPETALWRPVDSGYVTSDYGDRCYYSSSGYVCDFHTGIDLSRNGYVNIYSAGSGIVVGTDQFSCGGNLLYISHNVNGVTYTTTYAHLKRIFVSKGDIVSKNTVVAQMGGGESWDQCSTGQHVHFMVSKGLFQGYNSVIAGLTNPRYSINFPGEGAWFENRTTRY